MPVQIRRIALACLLAACALLFIAGMPAGEMPSVLDTEALSLFLFGRFTPAMLVAGFVMCASILGALYLVRRDA